MNATATKGDCETCDRTDVPLRLFNDSIRACDMCALDLENDPAIHTVKGPSEASE